MCKMRNDTDMDSWIKAKIKEEKTRLSQLLLSQTFKLDPTRSLIGSNDPDRRTNTYMTTPLTTYKTNRFHVTVGLYSNRS